MSATKPMRTRISHVLRGALLVALTGLSTTLWAAPAGEVETMRGVGSLQRPGKPAMLLGKGSAVEQGDTISTGPNSYAILKLQDGTRTTVRPDSQFVIQTYNYKPEAKEDESAGSMVFNLIKGGLRTITGVIPKRDINAARVVTATATVGIRGTDFDVRLCGTDCAREQALESGAKGANGAIAAPTVSSIPASARLVQLDGGDAHAIAINGTRRLLANGGPLYPGDTIETGPRAHAVLVFRDDSRVTVQPATRMKVSDFVFDDKNPKEGRVLLDLLKGGMRALTGLVGKSNHDNVAYRTATATVGIRGTGADMNCVGTCAGEPALPTGDGLTTTVWDGAIVVNANSGLCSGANCSLGVAVGESANIGANGAGVVKLPSTPPVMFFNTPRPDQIKVDMQKLFGRDEVSGTEAGLYVVVRDGHVSIETKDQVLDLGKGESGFTNGVTLVRPLTLPVFLNADKIPLPTGGNLAQSLFNTIKATGVGARCRP